MKLPVFLPIVLVAPVVYAAAGHDGGHNDKTSKMKHAHTSWPVAPEDYMAYVNSSTWANKNAIKRGKKLYQQNCLAFHGDSSQGDGPIATGLQHAPAASTNHFHNPDKMTDAYLFWRVFEGGTSEPFRSQGSALPAFKSALNEKQRWDVLSYVHHEFHENNMGSGMDNSHMENKAGMTDHANDMGTQQQ